MSSRSARPSRPPLRPRSASRPIRSRLPTPEENTTSTTTDPAVRFRDASVSFGDRTLWQGLDLSVGRGEYFAVLGPNGSGKSTLLRTMLGSLRLSSGTVEVLGRPARRGSPRIGYVPQQRMMNPDAPLRARDVVGLGLDGHRWGPGFFGSSKRRAVDAALERVGAADYANVPVGLLSGGEQQRLRVAQALVGSPEILLCDEALLSLDLRHQEVVAGLVEDYRRESGAAVVFVTHEINPIIDDVDRVLYLAHGRFTVGTVAEVMRTEVLSALYGSRVEVLDVNGRCVVVGTPEAGSAHHCEPEELSAALSAPIPGEAR